MTGAAVLLAFLAAGPAPAEIVERIVAKVGRDVITKTEWQDMVQAATAAGKKPSSAALGREVLERMISDRLVIQEAEAEGLKVADVEVGPPVDQELDAVRSRFKGEGEFAAQLRKEGITLEDLRQRYTAQVKDRYAYLKMMGRKQREFEASLDASEDEIKAYYEVHKATEPWMTVPQVHARHMQFNVDPALAGAARAEALAAARKLLAAARGALKRGETFGSVAQALSEDPTTRAAGGDLGTFGRGTYHEALERAAFSLKEGGVSGEIETPAGLHLVRVDEVLKPRQKTLDDPVSTAPATVSDDPAVAGEIPLRDHIRRTVKNEKMSKALQAWVDGLKARASIRRFLEEGPGT